MPLFLGLRGGWTKGGGSWKPCPRNYLRQTELFTSPLSLSIGWNGCGLPLRLLVHTSRGLYGPSTTFILPLQREHFISSGRQTLLYRTILLLLGIRSYQ